MLLIYNRYISTPVTFENVSPGVIDFEERVTTCLSAYPWIVAIDGGTVAGYAYAGIYRTRIAYQWCVESSVYLNDGYKKRGLGTQLYMALFELLKLQGIKKVYAGITTPNAESERFHEKFGFKKFALYKNVGYKNGEWRDVVWTELDLAEYAPNPMPPVKLPDLASHEVEAILGKYSH